MPTGRAQPGGRPARSHRQRSPRPRSPVRLPPPPGNLALKEKAAWRRTRKSQDRRRRCGRPLSSFSTCRLARIVGHRTQASGAATRRAPGARGSCLSSPAGTLARGASRRAPREPATRSCALPPPSAGSGSFFFTSSSLDRKAAPARDTGAQAPPPAEEATT
ncbi:uncharacterized protein [Oryctolagus cuniculus]|uniref:uncharacterized protein n=1 Tax=Oryctolagus cuniculus TaxID=9986 RepID=UPI00387A75F5